jgi:hypothetical protein
MRVSRVDRPHEWARYICCGLLLFLNEKSSVKRNDSRSVGVGSVCATKGGVWGARERERAREVVMCRVGANECVA